MKQKHSSSTYWQIVWKQFSRNRLALFSLTIVCLFCLVGIYAPFLASSKPLVVRFDGEWYFPLFRYLFFPGFFTKPLDLFYNLLIFIFPLFILAWISLKNRPKTRFWALITLLGIQGLFFGMILSRTPQDPAANPELNYAKQMQIQRQLAAEKQNPLLVSPLLPSWERELSYMTPYAKLNLILRYQQRENQDTRLQRFEESYVKEAQSRGKATSLPTLWRQDLQNQENDEAYQKSIIEQNQASYAKAKALYTRFRDQCQKNVSSDKLQPLMQCDYLMKLSQQDKESFLEAKRTVDAFEKAQAQLAYLQDRSTWLKKQASQLEFEVMPLLRPFHWEDDAGGEQALNRHISWWELTRVNRKDMVAALIFGIRVSLSVGLLSIGLALLIGIPIGAMAGYYGGKIDMVTYRLIEIWESMPTFFMLLMIVAFLQSKSIFLVIIVIGLFGWTRFSRFIRGEFFRQKQLPYVEACHAQGFSNRYIMFSHLLPNAIPPLLTLVPFAIMGAITSEAGLSFLGLGEEGSSSWGVLMDEGRSAFPAESYLLWPPAILLTILLVSIALVGDALRDALDPKLHS